ncbi:hypothetical protein [Photobacterium damselae]|uniref:hypothetical protein n=1 Tax=Photobacterium damselae TaxID=38293 RepID=UPI0012AD2D87|nr:hypothetical protein [Photobacterium damselae]
MAFVVNMAAVVQMSLKYHYADYIYNMKFVLYFGDNMSNEIISFKEMLMVRPVADGKTAFSSASETLKRQRAVVVALELIKADIGSAYSHAGSGDERTITLETHMKNLSEYADCILNAMES